MGCTMTDPDRRINTFNAFCSLLLPGLGQLLQKRIGTAIGFFTLFLLAGFLPGYIVTLLFIDRFEFQPLRVHVLHIALFAGLFVIFMLAVFWAVLDAAAWRPGEKKEQKQEEKPKEPYRFTLVELLVAIAVMGVLVVLLLPGIPAALYGGRQGEAAA